MAPSHVLREHINAIVSERLIRDGQVKGPALGSERLISRGYTHAERSIAANYAPGDVVAFHHPYKRLGVEMGGLEAETLAGTRPSVLGTSRGGLSPACRQACGTTATGRRAD